MRILVTGGAGFIGSHLVERLLAAGHSVRVLDNLSTGKRANLPVHPRLEFLQGDIRDMGAVDRAVVDVDALYHLAAVASVQASVDDPIGTHGANFGGTLNLLEAARRRSVRRFLYASSAAVYGDTAALPVTEDTVLRPLSPYAADKLAGEHYLSFYARKYDLTTTAFRFFNIYGSRQDPSSPYSGVISIFTEKVRAGQSVTLFGDGMQTRDFVYVTDLAEVLYKSLDEASAFSNVLNVGRGVECSLLDILSELEHLCSGRITRNYAPPRIGDIRRSCADTRRLEHALGYVPRTTLGTGLGRLVQNL